MNIVRKDIDSCNAILTLTIEKQDYSENVEKSLKEYRRKVQMPGFRPGNTPIGLVKKLYGKTVLVEEVNKLLSDSIYNYIKDNKIDILGEPLSNETEQKPLDFDNDETFEFVFDLGLSPQMDIDLTKRNKIPYYKITVSEEMVDNQIKIHSSRLGKYVSSEKTDENTLIKGDMTEITETSEPLKVVDAIINPKYVKDAKQKKLFINKKVGAVIKFNPVAAMTNEYEVSSLLNIAKDKVKDYDHDFEYVIKEIINHQGAELNQDFFDKVLGKGEVKTIEEFKEKIKEGVENSYIADSEYKFGIDVRNFLIKKNEKVEFPVEFIKRWLKTSNEKMTDEDLEKDFDKMLEFFKWEIIKRCFAEKYEIKIDEKEIIEAARQDVMIHFAQYGINNVQENVLSQYIDESLKQKGAYEKFYDKAIEQEVLDKVKNSVTLTEKEISLDEFHKMFAA